ncbi:MAG: zinc ribbon domain-containing protein [Bacillota bacterium]|nr:zinc ribbon domain-containing protein [Bacillota bacterium]
MLNAFTRNYTDNSTEAGFQFTFYCDICNNGFKSSFIESSTYNKRKGLQNLTRGASVLGNVLGGAAHNIGWGINRAGDILSERFEERSPEWQREHEQAFIAAQSEAQRHFRRCHACHKWVCANCFNEDEGMCVDCAPRQEIYVAKARAEAMKRNIDEAGQSATVWQGSIESKTTVCPACGKPAGSGKFCNNCGASLALNVCPACGKENAQSVKFCNHCGSPMTAPSGKCSACGTENPPGTKFCGNCGNKLA